MNPSHYSPPAAQRTLARIMAALMCAGSAPSALAVVDIPNTPLQASVAADPNIMMILDDSGSMHWEIMPDTYVFATYVFPRANSIYGGDDYDNDVATVDNSSYNAIARSPQVNTIYYNPGITYTPWSDVDGSLYPPASPSCALHNPRRNGTGPNYCRDLTVNNTQFNANTWVYCTSGCASSSFWPATYFWFNGGDIWTFGNYTRREIRSTQSSYSGEGRAARTDCTNGVCTYKQEIQNFANWYTYYRSRILTARAGIGHAFSAQGSGLRVGFGAINQASNSVDGGGNSSTIVLGVRQFSGSDRTNFFDTLYDRVVPTASTPLRRALDDAGKYYSRTDDQGPWSSTPGTRGGTPSACRQSYTILMTDGYWSDGSSNQASTKEARDNNDNTDGSVITGPNGQSYQFKAVSPFRDGNSNTLADVAAYYWKKDLRPDLTNSVPTSKRDPAFWQHMVTFGVGLGVSGSVNPDTAFLAIDKASPAITWPNPAGGDSSKLDDLLHAAVNSRGGYFSAKNPTEFSNALRDMLSQITDRKSAAGSVSANSTRLTTDSLIFSGSYNTADWSGELEAYSFTSTGISNTPVWKASGQMPAFDARKIYTISGGSKREFTWNNLSASDQATIGSAEIVDFIRGDRSKETSNGGMLRKRGTLLGDIVNSSPAYYRTRDGKDIRSVFVGANDGMLHAFDAGTGTERFAYIPSPMLGKLNQLSQPGYQHRFFVDGELEIADKADSLLTSSYLIGTLGRGDKGLFALDITNPESFKASNIAWEYVSSTDSDLGYMVGKPVFGRMNNGSSVVIAGNGYNSTNGKAVLYIFDLSSGSVVKKFDTGAGSDNGLAAPGVFDTDGDGLIDYIYAGDLKGNVWKFDVSDKLSSNWSQSLLYTAKDANGNAQPITGPIAAGVNYLLADPNVGKRYVFFGTGAYLRKNDPADKATQTWYGVIDNGGTISGRTTLKQRSILASFTADGKPARSFSIATKGDMAGKDGWYIDWNKPTDSGERMVSGSELYRLNEPTLVSSSVIPVSDDPCQPGGTGYINAINAFTGASLDSSMFVFSGSTGSNIVGSIDLGIGMPSKAALVSGGSDNGKIVASGSGAGGAAAGGTLGGANVAPKGYAKRIDWREVIRK